MTLHQLLCGATFASALLVVLLANSAFLGSSPLSKMAGAGMTASLAGAIVLAVLASTGDVDLYDALFAKLHIANEAYAYLTLGAIFTISYPTWRCMTEKEFNE